MSFNWPKFAFFLGGVTILVFGFQNCSMNSSHLDFATSDVASKVVINSADCDSISKATFQTTYYPVFRNKCVSCHDTGAGFGHFANSDFDTATAAFLSLGRSTVEHNFVNAGHQPGHTGPQNQAVIDTNKSAWDASDAQYASCIASKGASTAVVTTTLTNMNIFLGTAAFTHLEWNLNTDVGAAIQGKLPITVGIDVRLANVNAQLVGYEFRNPTAHLNSTTAPNFQLKNLHVVLNSVVLSDLTTYSLLDYSAASTSNIVMQTGAYGLAVMPYSNTDVFALKFDSILNSTGQTVVGTPGGTPGGTTPTTPTTVTFTQLNSADPTLGVFHASCIGCHGAGTKAGGLDLTSYTAAKLEATTINSRVNNSANPMPPGGLLGPDARSTINTWVSGGTPQ